MADSETLTPPGHQVSHLFFGPMNVHRGTVISEIPVVTVDLFCCIFFTLMLYMEDLRYNIRVTLHKNRK